MILHEFQSFAKTFPNPNRDSVFDHGKHPGGVLTFFL